MTRVIRMVETNRYQGGKCVPENEISTCRSDHDRMHFLSEPYLHRDELFEIKKRAEKLDVFQGGG